MKWLAFFLALFLFGCGDSPPGDKRLLEKLRILAVVASSPEAYPEQSITIIPVISDINGSGRELTLKVEGCPYEDIVEDDENTCRQSKHRAELFSGTVSGHLSPDSIGIPAFSSPNYTGALKAISVVLPESDIIFSDKSGFQQYLGVNYAITLEIWANGLENSVKGYKKVKVSVNTRKNLNPDINDFLYKGQSFLTFPTDDVSITPGFGQGSQENYTSYDFSTGTQENKDETLTVSWMVSDGDLRYYNTENENSVSFSPPVKIEAARNLVLVGVVRDGRGGTDVLIRYY